MAHLHNFNKHKPSIFSGIGQKIKYAAEVAGAAKTIYDIGKGIYSAASTVAPIAAALI